MIKTLLAFTVLVASPALAKGTIACVGTTEDYQGVGAHVDLSAHVQSNNVIYWVTLELTTNITGENDPTQETFETDNQEADGDYKPRNPRYKGMNRFEVGATEQLTLNLLLPKNFTKKTGTVRGYFQRVGHETYPTMALTCKYKRS